MKKIIIASILLSASATAARAGVIVDNVAVENFTAERNGNYLAIAMDVDLSGLDVKTNNCVVLSPCLINGADTLALDPIAVYGRRRYYHYLRSGADSLVPAPDRSFVYRASDRPDAVSYSRLVSYQPWMDGAVLTMRRIDRGCCGKVLLADSGEIGRCILPQTDTDILNSAVFFPELVYIRPAGEREKHRALEGRAYIDFPVNRTELRPDYRRNSAELAAIIATIDTVRNDRDASIDTVTLKGYASPESPYANNRRLAIGRTEALRRYINRLYDFGSATVITDYEPEDWDGLRRAVASSNLDNRDAIIALIDSDMDPDAKEARIKALYPDDYSFMLQTYYPALRHTDYRVSYVVRSFSDPAEILRIMKSRPQNLDQNEFYVAASELEPGSDEFTEVFETAVRMFPDDEIANLNAANAAMRRGDLDGADRYLAKAGSSPEAVYARGAVAIRRYDFDTARRYLRQAADAGLRQAELTLDELNEKTSKYNSENK